MGTGKIKLILKVPKPLEGMRMRRTLLDVAIMEAYHPGTHCSSIIPFLNPKSGVGALGEYI